MLGDPARTLVADARRSERERLVPLPRHPFECDQVKATRSGKTPYVRFDLNDYSIPYPLVRKTLTLIASPHEVRLATLDGTEVARRRRSYDRGQRIEDERHIAAFARTKRHAHQLRVRDRLRIVCPHANAFIEVLSRRDGAMSVETRRLEALLDQYGADELERALADALERGAISSAAVRYVLDQRARLRGEPPAVAVILPDNQHVRDLRVTPHRLDTYDQLTGEEDDDGDHHDD